CVGAAASKTSAKVTSEQRQVLHLSQKPARLVAAMSGWKDIVFICSVGFLVAWTALSLYGFIQAIVAFPDTYASLVASYPTLATDVGRQTALQGMILHHALRWSMVAVPLGLVAMLAKW